MNWFFNILPLIGGIAGWFLNKYFNAKSFEAETQRLRQQMITNNIAPMRQAWINNVRDALTEYLEANIKYCFSYTKMDFNPLAIKSNYIQIQVLQAKLKLMLPDPNKEMLAYNLLNSINKLHLLYDEFFKLVQIKIQQRQVNLSEKEKEELDKNGIQSEFWIKFIINNPYYRELMLQITEDGRLLLKKEWDVTKKIELPELFLTKWNKRFSLSRCQFYRKIKLKVLQSKWFIKFRKCTRYKFNKVNKKNKHH